MSALIEVSAVAQMPVSARSMVHRMPPRQPPLVSICSAYALSNPSSRALAGPSTTCTAGCRVAPAQMTLLKLSYCMPASGKRDGMPAVPQVDSFSFGVVLWELITKEQSQRGNWRPVRVPEECPAEVEQLLRVRQPALGPAIVLIMSFRRKGRSGCA